MGFEWPIVHLRLPVGIRSQRLKNCRRRQVCSELLTLAENRFGTQICSSLQPWCADLGEHQARSDCSRITAPARKLFAFNKNRASVGVNRLCGPEVSFGEVRPRASHNAVSGPRVSFPSNRYVHLDAAGAGELLRGAEVLRQGCPADTHDGGEVA